MQEPGSGLQELKCFRFGFWFGYKGFEASSVFGQWAW